MYIHAGDIFVIIGYYFKTIYLTVPEMTGPKICWAAICRKLFWAVYLVCYLLCLQCVYLSTVTHTEISSCCRGYFWGNKIERRGGRAWFKTKVNLTVYGKKTTAKKKALCHQNSVYHVSKRKYQLSTPPTLFCAISVGWNRSWMRIDPFYFRLLLLTKVSMDPITGGPWTPGRWFVLTREERPIER